MTRKQYLKSQRDSAIGVLLIAVAAYLGAGFWNFAMAQATSPLDATCSQLSSFGLTSGLVYCVTATIGNAVNTYVKILQNKFQVYEGMCLMVAVAAFGIKMMNSNMQYPIKETAVFIFRVLIGVFFYNQAATIYNDIAGVFPKYNGIMNQLIGWVTGFTGSGGASGSGNNVFSNLLSAKCQTGYFAFPNSGGGGFQGVQIWQAFDCMFGKIFGAVSPNPGSQVTTQIFFTSLAAVIGATILSGTLGVIVMGLGVSLFLTLILTLCRAVFMVLMAYLTIGFMAIFSPLIAPLLFFDSDYLTEKFKNWIGIIISSIFQPVFVIGFLGLTVAVDDFFIEGNVPGCKPPTYPPISGSGGSSPGSGGYGQDGSGVCSFTQLLYGNSGAASGSGAQAGVFFNFLEHNYTIWQESYGGDCQGHNFNGTLGSIQPFDCIGDKFQGINNTKSDANLNTQQFAAWNGNFDLAGTTRLKKYFPLRQLILTLMTFLFINKIMMDLSQTVTAMAASMTISAGSHVITHLQVPFEGVINSFLEGFDRAAMGVGSGKGLLSGNLKGPSAFFDATLAGIRGGISNVLNE